MFTSTQAQLTRARLISGLVDETKQLSTEANTLTSPKSFFVIPGAVAARIDSWLLQANYNPSQIQLVKSLGLVLLILTAAASFYLRSPLLLLLIPLTLTLSFFLNGLRTFRRAENFERDYPTLLISLASSVKTGLDPAVALSGCDRLFAPDSEVAKAIGEFRSAIERGVREETAIFDFARDIRHPDIQLFRSAFALSRRHGSSIGECLYRLTRVTRQRQSFRRKMRAAVAMQKLSAIGIGACAVTISLIQYLSNPQALNAAFAHPVGFKLLVFGFSLICIGLAWMLFMVRARL